MSEAPLGVPAWHDLTVPNAEEVRDFYQHVIGWQFQPMKMRDYEDYVMVTEAGFPAGGICHARGTNASLPPVWLIYFTVPDVAEAVERCRGAGGKVLFVSNLDVLGGYAIIQDPAGAVCAISAPPPSDEE